MLFNSLEFALFLPLVLGLYWAIGARRRQVQNALLLVASYVFYGWWDWRFLSLIVLSSAVDYAVGLALGRTTRPRRRTALLLVSIVVNIGALGFFKYAGFFVENFVEACALFGVHPNVGTLHIILPVGISFYTFQTLSYTIDVYRGRIEPTRNILTFFAFVSFFPQLVAGPIERASNLLGQFEQRRACTYDQFRDGARQILWGLFKKVVVADTLGTLVNNVFASPAEAVAPLSLWLGAIAFAFQIYGDFSGYSDIAIGTARLFGFSLMRNFAYPYFARDIAEFWRRWHISLSTWFRDYVYVPLGGSRSTLNRTLINIAVVFVVSGFWHGARWTFILWGTLHALYYVPLLLTQRHRQNLDVTAANRILPTGSEAFGMVVTFLLAVMAWVVFRAESVSAAVDYWAGMFRANPTGLDMWETKHLVVIGVLIIWEWLQRHRAHGLAFEKSPVMFRWASYTAICLAIMACNDTGREFIYFQF